MATAPTPPSSGRLNKKVAIVTGGSSSIGRAICLAYTREGATVVVADIRPDSRAHSEATGWATADLIRSEGGVAEFMRCDVTKEKDVDEVVRKCVEMFGRVDMYVCTFSVLVYGIC